MPWFLEFNAVWSRSLNETSHPFSNCSAFMIPDSLGLNISLNRGRLISLSLSPVISLILTLSLPLPSSLVLSPPRILRWWDGDVVGGTRDQIHTNFSLLSSTKLSSFPFLFNKCETRLAADGSGMCQWGHTGSENAANCVEVNPRSTSEFRQLHIRINEDNTDRKYRHIHCRH